MIVECYRLPGVPLRGAHPAGGLPGDDIRRPRRDRRPHRARTAVTEKRSTGWAPAAIAAVVLLIAAVLCFGLSASFKATGRHAYNSGQPASTFALTAGKQYQLSVRGGRSALTARGLSADQPQCSWSLGNAVAQALTVSPLPADTRSVNVVATFVAPATGRLDIGCATWGAVFVDDSERLGVRSGRAVPAPRDRHVNVRAGAGAGHTLSPSGRCGPVNARWRGSLGLARRQSYCYCLVTKAEWSARTRAPSAIWSRRRIPHRA